jgi:branched-chain amino acid transport system permease protein
MSVELVPQMTVTGLVMGLIYILSALGITLIFGVMRVVNFVHGEMIMLAAFSMYYLYTELALPFLVALALTCGVISVAGLLVQRTLYRPLGYDLLKCLIIGAGASFALRSLAWIVFGPVPRDIPTLLPGVLSFAGAHVSNERLVVVGICIVLTAALYVFLYRTRAGRSMRAVEQDAEAAVLMGVDIDRVYLMVFVVGSTLAAVAGALVGMLFVAEPEMGSEPLLKSFIIIQIGGMGSIGGAVIAGLAIGLIDSFTETILGGELAFIVDFAILMALLIVRPRGLFGYDV